ncbi:MAG: hypothetical protein JWN46_2137 [Acidimicrobiales bacterium]|nr:hypothetical protein [Acidimicrobiales bacterium]
MTDLDERALDPPVVVGAARSHVRVEFPDPFTRIGRFLRRTWRRAGDEPARAAEAILSAAVVIGCVVLVIGTLHPSQLLRDTTPTGGDMGSHVWGPDYLLHHLLPKGRLSGWTPDWYNGFPAYQFYMVVPSLLVVALTVGVRGVLVVPAVIACVVLAASGWCHPRLYRFRRPLLVAGLVALVLAVPLPYNVAFKLVTVLGLVGLPIAAWAFGKLADLPFPVPPLCALAALLFIYNREPIYNGYGNIIGGNMTSTMAGEFAFSISLTLCVLYLGVAARGLRTGRHRALAAGLFALAGLCHLIPAFFVLTCTALLFLVHPSRARVRWLATVVPVGGLLTAFWVLPFWGRSDFVNNMGWEKLPVPSTDPAQAKDLWFYLNPPNLRVFIILGVVGIVVSLLLRHTVGIVLASAWAIVMVAFRYLPEARLWNARLLPFLYLSVFLLAAIGIGEVARSITVLVAPDPDRPVRPVGIVALFLATALVIGYVGMPLTSRNADGSQGGVLPIATRGADGRSHLLWFSGKDTNPVGSWASWNYSGLQAKPATTVSGGWPEYQAFVATMAGLGRDPAHGCGRTMWEYSKDRLEGYGTPMALMMLPYFTNGCIGSQEGLYFEASTTTPFHFLMQAELSASGSNPQRDLPYPGLDMTNGVRHLRMLGVKYYAATSSQAVDAASLERGLRQVAVSGPWHVYQVLDAPTVEPLQYEPVVWSNVGQAQSQWLDPAIAWFLDPSRQDVPLAVSGPASWARARLDRVDPNLTKLVGYVRGQTGRTAVVQKLPDVPRKRLPAVQVTNTKMGDDSVSFDVSRVGVPVVVKVSYFPNWTASGADGPYRITPNSMVVIPRSKHVSLHFGRTSLDVGASVLTVVGVGGLIVLGRLPAVAMPPQGPAWLVRWWRRRRAERAPRRGSTPSAGPPPSEWDDAGVPPVVVTVLPEPGHAVRPRTVLPGPEEPGG